MTEEDVMEEMERSRRNMCAFSNEFEEKPSLLEKRSAEGGRGGVQEKKDEGLKVEGFCFVETSGSLRFCKQR